MDAHTLELAHNVAELVQLGLIGLARSPDRGKGLGPAFSLQPAQHPQGIFFVEDLFELVTGQRRAQRLDVLLGLADLVALLRPLFHLPAETR